MVERADEPDVASEYEGIAAQSEAASSGFERAVEDMRAMAKDREDKGFQTLTIPAGDVATKNPSDGDDEWGLSFVIPGDKAEEFEYFYEEGEYEDTGVYQSGTAAHVFIVTEHVDLDAGLVVFLAGSYEKRYAAPMVRTAMDRGRMYTHVKKLDSTHLGTFAHDDPSEFFPDPESFYSYEQGP